jgi:hypothetical protein
VVKATPTMTVTRSPAVVHVDTTRVTLTVQLTAPGFTPVTGTVKVSAGGHSYARVLSGGTAVFTLAPFNGTGAKQVTVTYVAQTLTKQVKKTITVTVVR